MHVCSPKQVSRAETTPPDIRVHDFLLRDHAHICKAHDTHRGAKQIADATFKGRAETNSNTSSPKKGANQIE